ncbi:MAG: type II secretion system F family protein [Rhodocyclaceae bacterium]|nr:type II secretion system F family protein [Rhodocyclaceae bacterium]
MSTFNYRGRDRAGKLVKGTIEGDSASAAASNLMATGVTPLEIRPASSAKPVAKGSTETSGGKGKDLELFAPKVQHADILIFTRQIHTLLKAGVPIMRALTGLQESNTNPAMKALLKDVKESLDAGRDLSLSFARHPKEFSTFYLSMIRVGEMTGRLEEIFIRLFHHMEFEKYMREQVQSALRYPSFVMMAMGVAMVVINIWVIPAFAGVFKGFGAELPLMTRILIGFSGFMVTWWPALILGGGALFIGMRSYVNTPAGRLWWDYTKMSVPIAGKIVRKATLARFARSFSLASRSGVPAVQAMTTVALTVDNEYMAQKISSIRHSVERGESILKSSMATGIFTPVVLQMIAVGEESGSLDEMMEEIAEMYQSEVEYELKTLSQQIEPIMIIMLGGMVLVLALGIFLPLWDMGKVAK